MSSPRAWKMASIMLMWPGDSDCMDGMSSQKVSQIHSGKDILSRYFSSGPRASEASTCTDSCVVMASWDAPEDNL